MNFDNITLPA